MFSLPDEGLLGGGRTNDTFELLKAWAGTTLAYAILITGATQILNNLGEFTINLLIAGIVCGLAFVFHELAHRIVARNYGAEAHFIANNGWLLMSIVISFLGFFIAAPGAVWHRGYLTPRQGGLIALAGPVTNLVFAVLFLLAGIVLVAIRASLPESIFDLGLQVCLIGYRLNAWIGLFNMIPAGPFDGAKVLNWSPLVFGITVAVGLVMTFLINESVVISLLGVFA
ncbi:MAG: peptidase M50 [Blastochloris sp.]|nr:peptidase M50 [Blastochloris sp.]